MAVREVVLIVLVAVIGPVFPAGTCRRFPWATSTYFHYCFASKAQRYYRSTSYGWADTAVGRLENTLMTLL